MLNKRKKISLREIILTFACFLAEFVQLNYYLSIN